MNVSLKEMQEQALSYADSGLPIFRIVPNCKVPLKDSNGHLAATADKEKVREWWRDKPYNIAVNCGMAKLVVIDLDVKPDVNGIDNFEKWLNGCELPKTLTVKTRSGGKHFYFNGTGIKSSQNLLCEGVDIRAEGGYVLLPPSYVEADTKGCAGSYTVIEQAPIADLPDWLRAELLERQPKEKKPLDAMLFNDPLSNALLHQFPYCKENVDKLIQAVRERLQKKDCTTESEWFKLLLEFRSLVYLCKWDDAEAWDVFDTMCQEIGGNYDVDKNRKRWDMDDFDPNGRTYKSLLDELKTSQELAALTPTKRFQPLTIQQLQNQPQARWLIRNIIPEKGIAAVYGASGSGKTFIVLDMLMAIALGQSWFYYKVKKPQTVVYLVLEGGAGINQRIKAYLKHYAINPPDNFHIVNDHFDIRQETRLLLHAIVALNPAIVVIDTLAQSAAGMDENTNSDMSLVLSNAKAIADAINGVCLLVHHTGKDSSKGLRGHSSLIAALDCAIEVQPATTTKPRTWRVAKSKDSSADVEHGFNLRVIDLCRDEEGDVIDSCVIEPSFGALFAATRQPTGKNQIAAYDLLKPLCPISLADATTKVMGVIGSSRTKSRAKEVIEGLVNQAFFSLNEGVLNTVETSKLVETS